MNRSTTRFGWWAIVWTSSGQLWTRLGIRAWLTPSASRWRCCRTSRPGSCTNSRNIRELFKDTATPGKIFETCTIALIITDCYFKIRRVTQVLKFISYTRPVYFVGSKALVSFFIRDHFRVCDYNQIFVIVIPQLIHLSVNLIIIVLTSQINKRHNYFLPLMLKIIFETYIDRP